jgi:hypothetical protein
MINVGPVEPLIKAMDNTIQTIRDHFDFKHYVILTNKDITHDRYEIKKVPEMNRDEYNIFCVKELWKFCETSHFLMLHTDGFILHPELWDDKWLEYDYIAAPWSDGKIGGGGFSLRSVKLAHYVSEKFGDLIKLKNINEDGYYSNILNGREKTIKYPSIEEALKFSQEILFDPNIIPFGIHDSKLYTNNAFNYWKNQCLNKIKIKNICIHKIEKK